MKKLSITEAQLDRAIFIIKKRHKKENWIIIRKSKNGEVIIYLKLECVIWLEEVHFNTLGFWLEREISFYQKQILRLENELGLSPKEEAYDCCSTGELQKIFKKSKNSIFKAIQRMTERADNSFKIYKNNHVLITPEGVKWLREKYFRKDYLRYLEDYKLELQRIKMEKET